VWIFFSFSGLFVGQFVLDETKRMVGLVAGTSADSDRVAG